MLKISNAYTPLKHRRIIFIYAADFNSRPVLQ